MIFMMNKNSIIAAVAVAALLGNGSDAATCGNLPEGSAMPKDGDNCLPAMIEGSATIGCEGESYSGSTKTAATCTCEPSLKTTWTCKTTDSEVVVADCPAPDDPKATGDSCAGLLTEPNAQQKCMWSQKVSTESAVSSFWCTCANTGANADKWVCDGTLPPIVDPTMMDANTQQDVTTTSTTPASGTGSGSMATCPQNKPDDSSTCAGFLQGDLPTASCMFSQTITTSGAANTETVTCTCAKTDESWRCDGTFSPAPANAVVFSKDNEESNAPDVELVLATDGSTSSSAATADVVAATDESASSSAAANGMNFAAMTFVVAVVATTTTIF